MNREQRYSLVALSVDKNSALTNFKRTHRHISYATELATIRNVSNYSSKAFFPLLSAQIRV